MRCKINTLKTGKFSVSQEASLVLSIAKWAVSGARDPQIQQLLSSRGLDWLALNTFLSRQELSAFAYSCLKDYFPLLPAQEADLLKKNHYFVLARQTALQNEFIQIHDLFCQTRLELLPLKGAAFLAENLYGARSSLRSMSDVDILIKKESLPQAEELLARLGYQKQLWGLKENYWLEKHYHLIFEKPAGKNNFFTLEVHWLLDYPAKTPLLPQLWNRARVLKFQGRDIRLLSPEDAIFSLVLNLRPFGNVLALKSACDFACLLNKYKDLDWGYILRESKSGQMRAGLYFRLMQASLFFDIRSPDSVYAALGPSGYKKRLIENFIARNTFLGEGREDKGIFLKHHFLVYDNFWQPLSRVINIPQEQFAKFYGLDPYGLAASILYRLRFLFFLGHAVILILRAMLKRLIRGKRLS